MSSSTDQAENSQACAFSNNLDILRELPFFTGIPLDVMKVLAYLSSSESFREGDVICAQGESLENCYFVKCGQIEVVRQAEDGEASIAKHGEGFFFGGLALLSQASPLFTVRALKDTECLVISREKFCKTVERFPDILPRILQSVVNHIFKWEEKFLSAHGQECAANGTRDLGLSLF